MEKSRELDCRRLDGVLRASVVVLALLLHSERFHNYLLRTAKQKATEDWAAGRRCAISPFTGTGISPTVDLYGIVIHGAAPYSDPPLLEADALHVGLTVTSLLHKAWYVSDVRIERPVVRIFADRDGHTNLPSPPQTKENKSRQSINIFDLGIRHLLLERGEIYYNDRKSDLSADLHDLSLQSGFEMLKRRYSGTLSYRDGHLQLQNATSIEHNFNARFVASSEEFKLESAELRSGNSRLVLVGSLQDYSQPRVHATYEGTIDAGEFRRIVKNPSLPAGIVQATGVIDYDSRSKGPLVASATARGDVRSASIAVASGKAKLDLRNIGAHYSLAKGNAEVSGIHADLLGGALSGSMTMRDLAGSTRSHLSASLQSVSMSELQRAMQNAAPSSASAQIAVQGSLNATADATWGKSIQDLVARADASVQASARPAQGGATTPSTARFMPDTAAKIASWLSSRAISEPLVPQSPSAAASGTGLLFRFVLIAMTYMNSKPLQTRFAPRARNQSESTATQL